MDEFHRPVGRAPGRRQSPAISASPLVAGLLLVFVLLASHAAAQVSMTGRGKNFVAPVTDAEGKRSVLRGKDVKPAGRGLVEITGMQAETFRGPEKDLIIEAPQCVFDTRSNVATSPGRLTIRTADGRFSIEGESFQWQLGDSRLSSRLVISNKVHSLVRKGAISSKPAAAADRPVGPSATGAPPTAERGPDASLADYIDISSSQFEYQSDRAVFRQAVRVREAEGDLACQILTVLFQGEGGAMDRIEAEQDVVLNQGDTRATADKAVYRVSPHSEVVEFLGNARWTDGGRDGRGERLIFDRRQRTLRADEKARLQLPRSVLAGSGFLFNPSGAAAPGRTNQAASTVEVYSDLITVRLPETNGPVQQIVAEKNVLIVDMEQEGRALADRAVYEEATGVLQLTGAAMMETERRLVSGHTLQFNRATRVFTAAPDAYVKLPVQSLAHLGMFSSQNGAGPNEAAATNQFIEVWAKEFQHHTNLLQFSGDVRGNFLKDNVAQGKITCGLLRILYGERLESLVAETQVELEQFAAADSSPAADRKVRCERLTASFTPEGRIALAVAEQGVHAQQEERWTNSAPPLVTQLRSDKVSAIFSRWSNQVERIEADSRVVFSQDQRTARGAKAVYTEKDRQVELTGQPTATMPEGRITEAERLIWDRVTGRFAAKGRFKSEWQSPPGGTNGLSRSVPGRN